MSDAELKELVDRVITADDQDAFKKLYFHYYGKLFDLAIFYTKCPENAEEIVNDTFLNIWQRRAWLAQIGNFPSYLYKATKNQSLNFLNGKKHPIFLDIDELPAEIADISLSADDRLILADLSKLIKIAVNQLPAQCKIVFTMVKEESMPQKEVAGLLNISVRTVEYHMGIALKKISESLRTSARNLKQY